MLSRVVSGMLRDGLLERSNDAGDRRAAWVAVTAAGRRLAERMRRERTEAVNAAMGGLGAAELTPDRGRAARARVARRAAEGAVARDARDARRAATTFAALSVPNFRRYYGGQSISLIGTWMQMTAQAWLVLTLTHSSAALGGIVALQTLPVLLLAPYGGVIADRVDKRKLMIASADADGTAGARARRADRHRRGPGVADRRARRDPRRQQRVREPVAPVVHARDGRARAPAQRGQPQLGARQRRPQRSARRSPGC